MFLTSLMFTLRYNLLLIEPVHLTLMHFSAKPPFGENADGENSVRQIFRLAKFHYGENSVRRKYHLAKKFRLKFLAPHTLGLTNLGNFFLNFSYLWLLFYTCFWLNLKWNRNKSVTDSTLYYKSITSTAWLLMLQVVIIFIKSYIFTSSSRLRNFYVCMQG